MYVIVFLLLLTILVKLANSYNFLVKLRKSKISIKMIWGVVFLFFGPLSFFYYLWLLLRTKDTEPKKFACEIEMFLRNYGTLRTYVKGSENSMIYMGSYVCELKGKICYLSKFISIYAKNLPQHVENEYPTLEKRKIEEDIYYQIPIKRKYSKIAKHTIICAVLEDIREQYPEDKLFFDKTIPIGMVGVDMKKAWSLGD